MMKSKKTHFVALIVFASLMTRAEVPAPEKLLPADTLAVVTVPDYSKASTTFKSAPLLRLWNDVAMQPFRQKFEAKFKTEAAEFMEKEFGIRLGDYTALVQGQITFAVIQNGWKGQPDSFPGWVFLLDAKQESTNLKVRLAELRKKWTDTGKQFKSEKIRDVEVTTLFIKPDGGVRDKAKQAGAEGGKPARPFEISIGQSDSLLLVGSSLKVLEKVLVRQSGGALPGLNEQSAFETSQRSVLRDSLAYGWGNMALLYDVLSRMATESSIQSPQTGSLAPSSAKALTASGLSGLETLAISMGHTPEGNLITFSLGAPGTRREGLLKLMALEAKESSPPPFIPSNVTKFRRWRLDGQKVWSSLESMIAQLSPQLNGVLQMSLGALGKDKDPNFDFKKSFIANLGDDLISIQQAPRANTPAELDSPPSLFLVGSPKPDQLVQAIKAATALMPSMPGEGLKEREFQGRKIYSLPLAPLPDQPASPPRLFLFAASGSYVAMSADNAMIEEYLRNTETTSKPLRDVVGLGEAAQRVGGFGAGMFGYDNYVETMKSMFELFKAGGGSVDKLLADAPLTGKTDLDENLKEWFDFAMLPPFEKVEKYFYYTIFAGGADDRGFSAKLFLPTPPKLKAP